MPFDIDLGDGLWLWWDTKDKNGKERTYHLHIEPLRLHVCAGEQREGEEDVRMYFGGHSCGRRG